MTYHRIGYFYEGKKKRCIIFQVREFNSKYYWRLSFRMTNPEIDIYFRRCTLYDWINHRVGDDTTYKYKTDIKSFNKSWNELIDTVYFNDLKHDFFKVLKAHIDMHKFKQLYEKYRIEDKLLHQL